MNTSVSEFHHSLVRQRLGSVLAVGVLPCFSVIFCFDYSGISNGQDGCHEFNSMSTEVEHGMCPVLAFHKREDLQISAEKHTQRLSYGH